MAATTGLSVSIETDLLNHLSPNTGAVSTTTTVTGPLKLALMTAASQNTAAGTECTDATYARVAITWTAATTTPGSGAAGYVSKTNTFALTFGGGTGLATAQVVTGTALYSSDATPVFVAYQNFALSINVPAGYQYVIAVGACQFSLS